jgi:CBS domain-containing protein
MTVAAILEGKGRNVVTTTPKASVSDVVTALARHRIGAVVVVDSAQKILGIVSERDVVRALSSGSDVLAGPVASIMTRNVITCGETDTVDQVMALMTRGHFRHVPVIADGRLAGIVSIGDVVKARIEQIEREAEHMRAYIASA